MKKIILLILFCILASNAFSAKIGDDTVYIGQDGSTSEKAFIFQDVNGSKLAVDHTTGNLYYTGDQLAIGDGTDTDKTFVFDIGLGASNPAFLWDTTKQKLRQSIGGVVKDIGSGSGSGGGSNFNNGFTSEQNASAEDGTSGWTSSAGTFAVNTSDPLSGDQSFEWTPNAQNDTLTSSTLDFDKDIFKGKSCQAQIDYIGGDENLTLKVLNADDEELVVKELTAQTISAPFNMFFLCPNATDISGDADKGNLRLVLENTGASASALIKFDNAYVGTLIGLSESSLPDSCSAYISNNGTPAIVTQQGDCIDSVSLVGTGRVQLNFPSGEYTVNPSVTISTINNTGVVAYAAAISSTPALSTSSVTVETFANLDGAVVNRNFWVTITKQGADAKQSVQVFSSIPRVSENVNDFSAQIADGNPAIVSDENVEWLNGNCSRAVAGTYLCTTYEDTANLNCWAQVTDNLGTGLSTEVNKTGTNELRIRAALDGTAYQNRDLALFCKKTNSAFKLPTVQPVIVGQVQNSYASSAKRNARVESCKVRHSGGIPSAQSDLCDSWISSIDDVSSGLSQINFISGTFTLPPVCVVIGNPETASGTTARIGEDSVPTTKDLVRIYGIVTSTGGLADTGYNIVCVGI